MDPMREAGGKLGDYAYSQPGKPAGGDRSFADILKETLSNVQDLVRAEVQLAKLETKQELRKATGAGIMFGAAAVLGLAGFGFLCLCVVYALALVMPAWAAALIVGAVLCIVGGILASVGKERWKKIKLPEKTMFTVKEDVEWMRSQNKS